MPALLRTLLLLALIAPASLAIEVPLPVAPADAPRARVLKGEYGRFRANNDLLHYVLDIRVDPEARTIHGKNTIRFRMLRADHQIQLDLYENLNVEMIEMDGRALKFAREVNAVFVRFPEELVAGQEYSIDFHYSGDWSNVERPRGIRFRKDPTGKPWVTTSCEGPGGSTWWPGKDQWRDEVEGMDFRVAVPNGLTNVSNGRLIGKQDLGDGYTRWDWRVTYPINTYCISINVGDYEHFSDRLGDLTLDYYVLPADLQRAKRQFAQVKPMMEAFLHYFGEYPFARDGYKLVHVPYAGMEHQSAVTYGNGFENGYGGRDFTGVGISPRFDFIIIHESGHEWFGNAVSAADIADMWIHEGFTTYLEAMYVEHLWGYEDAIRYLNGNLSKIRNERPIITTRALHESPSQDQYFKGAMFLNTLRHVMNDDQRWWALIRETYDRFKYKNVMTEQVMSLFNERFDVDVAPVFEQYLRHPQPPTLELVFDEAAGTVDYRWRADAAGFAMPVRVGDPDAWKTITPTADWRTLPAPGGGDAFEVDVDHFYVLVDRSDRDS